MHVLSRAVPTNFLASCVSKHVSPPYRRTNRIQIQIDAEVFFQYGALFVFPVHIHFFLKLAFFQIQCFFFLLHFNPSNVIIKVFACPWPSTWVAWGPTRTWNTNRMSRDITSILGAKKTYRYDCTWILETSDQSAMIWHPRQVTSSVDISPISNYDSRLLGCPSLAFSVPVT